MKYKLIIDKNADEEIIAIVHAPSSLTQRIEDLVCGYSGADSIMGYSDDKMRKVFDSTKDENGKMLPTHGSTGEFAMAGRETRPLQVLRSHRHPMAGKYHDIEIMLDYTTGRTVKLGEITPEWWIQ